MKKKNGFTLIELLAVLIVLGVLVGLIIPKVVTTLNEAEKNANMTSARELIKAAEYKYANEDMKGTATGITINYEDKVNGNIDYLDYKGDKPEIGQVAIKANGKIAISVKFGDYCYTKASNSNDIIVSNYSASSCGKNADVFTNYELPPTAIAGESGLYKDEAQSELEIEEARYVYRGQNPNNYIKLKEGNEEVLYRIISFEENGTIKVIRDDYITNPDNPSEKTIEWDKRTSESTGPRKNDNNSYCNYSGTYYGCNVWGNMNNTTYNGTPLANLYLGSFHYKYFENNINNSLLDHTNTGTVNDNSSLNEYLNGTWLTNSGLSKYIDENSVFDVGGLYYHSTYNGGDKGIYKEKEEISIYKWTGKVGLMYITDMVETSLISTCDSVYDNFYYNTNYWYKNEGASENTQHIANYEWPCTTNNWMFKRTSEWSLSAHSNYRNNVWIVYGTGYFSRNDASYARGVRPVFYLKSSISLRGTGTISDPYEIVES